MEVLGWESGGNALAGASSRHAGRGHRHRRRTPSTPAARRSGLGYGCPFAADAVRGHSGRRAPARTIWWCRRLQPGRHPRDEPRRDTAFLAEHDVGFVLTAGSPVAGIAAGPGVRSVHLEHVADWVPGADAIPIRTGGNRSTVTLTDPSRSGAQAPGLGPGHALQNYVQGARDMEASRDPSAGRRRRARARRRGRHGRRRHQPDGASPAA